MKKNLALPIREVYQSNFRTEMKCLSKMIKKYNYIGMDTEFPGTPFSSNLNSYKAIKQNVDSLKLIQAGISVADKYGNRPDECGTWQFNLRFSIKTDKYSADSINMLTGCGIDFNELEKEGIAQEIFAEYLLSSGLVLNEDVKWVCFHGVYDFAYLLHTITNLPLPETETGFFNDLKIYFPCFFDIRYLIRYNENLYGSLSKLAQDLNVKRYGIQHQAGSDSLLTIEIFIKLFQDEYIAEEYAYADRNCLFGISPDDPTLLEQKTKEYGNGTNTVGMNYDYNYFQPNSVNTLSTMSQLNINPINNQRLQYSYYRNANSNNSNSNPNSNSSYYLQANNYYPYSMGMPYSIISQQDSSGIKIGLPMQNIGLSDQKIKTRKEDGED